MSEGTVAFERRGGGTSRVAYRRAGTGPAVVLLSGVGLQKAVWGPQMDALVADHDVVAMDMPGHGGFSRPPEAPVLGDYSDAVLALLDGLGIARAHVVGHSMGALVALAGRGKRMARPVGKWFLGSSLICLHKRIRPSGEPLAKMESRASWSS